MYKFYLIVKKYNKKYKTCVIIRMFTKNKNALKQALKIKVIRYSWGISGVELRNICAKLTINPKAMEKKNTET